MQPPMEVCFLASGEKVAVLEAAEFEGKSAKVVKQALAPKIGVTRFRQRRFLEGDAVEIPDDEVFASAPVKVQLVVLKFCPPDAEEDKRMILAAKEDDTVGLEWLLKSPRSPNTRDADGMTPLHHAAERGHVEPTRLLVESGAEIDASRTPPEIDPFRTPIGSTPLNLAVSHGHFEIAHILVEKGANTDELFTRKNLIYAVKYNSLNMVRFLVEMGCDKEMTDEWGATPLIAAAQRGYLKTVRFLVKSGASPHAADIFGKTALDHASLCGHARVVRYLSDKADSPRRKVRRLNNSSG